LANGEPDAGGILSLVAERLRALRSGGPQGDPVTLVMLRGGVAASSAWRDDPTACMVLCATPDMWGSRLLLRGYGTSRHARAREAGLLAYDAVVVVDEAHLARQLLYTARRLEHLEASARGSIKVPILQVVNTTATPAADVDGLPLHEHPTVVRVEAADFVAAGTADSALERRLCTPKRVRSTPLANWPTASAAEREALGLAVADVAEGLRERYGPTVGCVFNTVATALAVAEQLKKRHRQVEVLVGRMRPYDVDQLRRRRPGLLTTRGDNAVDFVVATQTIEVGVDADFSAMVTELAPGSALAQRAGRVNRVGGRAATEVVVFCPEGDPPCTRDALPYRAVDLSASWEWLRRREEDPQGLAPWALVVDPPPAQGLSRTLLQRPERWDAWYWARTSDDLVAEPDLDLWLSDDLEADRDVALAVRQGLPAAEADAVALLRATMPRDKELFPVPIRVADQVRQERVQGSCYLVRDEEVTRLLPTDRLRPGDVFVIDAASACFRSGVVDELGSDAASDVLEAGLGRPDDPFVVRIAPGAPIDDGESGGFAAALLAELVATYDAFPKDGRPRRDALAEVLRLHAVHATGPAIAALAEAQKRLSGRINDTDIVLGPRTAEADPAWLVIQDVRRYAGDEELRQVWAGSGQIVTLAAHSDAVAERAAAMAARLALSEELVAVLREAGQLHDQGKRDPRFQAMLQDDGDAILTGDGVVLAKSGRRRPADARAAWARSGLPLRWRHEQLSAACAWDSLRETPAGHRELATRLVGTSHGRGRSGFPHVGSELTDGGSPAGGSAGALFDAGAWDELVEHTHRWWGVWGCAFLEALLRAADCQVSGEGR
jgi:CRISPR-associated endonuclease/helicase Cas3